MFELCSSQETLVPYFKTRSATPKLRKPEIRNLATRNLKQKPPETTINSKKRSARIGFASSRERVGVKIKYASCIDKIKKQKIGR